jgi:hypothetical protein
MEAQTPVHYFLLPYLFASYSYFLPSRFCAITNPRGVGSNNTDSSPSLSIFNAASRTVFIAELASCIKINPYGFT